MEPDPGSRDPRSGRRPLLRWTACRIRGGVPSPGAPLPAIACSLNCRTGRSRPMSARKAALKFFDPVAFLPPDLYAAITDVRIERPAIVQEEAERRKRRSVPAPDGALVILAADHPGRNVLNGKDDPLGMAGMDGIMGTPDLVEDLFILTRLIKERGGSSLLDDRLLVGCMNRGGLRGTAFEMEDTFTAFTTERMQALRMDGAKFMFRLDPTDPPP